MANGLGPLLLLGGLGGLLLLARKKDDGIHIIVPDEGNEECPPRAPAGKLYMDLRLKPHPKALTARALAKMSPGTKVGMAVSLQHEDEELPEDALTSVILGETVYVAPGRLTMTDDYYAIEFGCRWIGKAGYVLAAHEGGNYAEAFAKYGFIFPTDMIGQIIPQKYVHEMYAEFLS